MFGCAFETLNYMSAAYNWLWSSFVNHITASNVGAVPSLELLTLHVGKAESKSLMMVLLESPASPMVHDETLEGHFSMHTLVGVQNVFQILFLV